MMSNNFNSNPYFSPNGQVPRARGVRLLPKAWAAFFKRHKVFTAVLIAVLVVVVIAAIIYGSSHLQEQQSERDEFIADTHYLVRWVRNDLDNAIQNVEAGYLETANEFFWEMISDLGYLHGHLMTTGEVSIGESYLGNDVEWYPDIFTGGEFDGMKELAREYRDRTAAGEGLTDAELAELYELRTAFSAFVASLDVKEGHDKFGRLRATVNCTDRGYFYALDVLFDDIAAALN